MAKETNRFGRLSIYQQAAQENLPVGKRAKAKNKNTTSPFKGQAKKVNVTKGK